MKKFFLKMLVLVVPFIIVILVIVLLFSIPDNSYDLAVIDKNKRLMNTESPRIVLAGGSGLAFGIDSAMIQNTFHIPVVNMGVHAAFGLGRILDNASPFLRRGDILIIVPEYQNFTNLWNGKREAYELIFDARQYRLLVSTRYGLPDNFSGFLKTHQDAISAQYRLLPRNPLAYSRDGFNEYGDYIKHLSTENTPVISYENIGSLNSSYLASFFKFIDFFTGQGITVLLSYPGFEEQSWHNSAGAIEELDAILRKKENLLVISDPQTYCFPASLFYDSIYHLNAEGRNLRTKQLIRDLLAVMAGKENVPE